MREAGTRRQCFSRYLLIPTKLSIARTEPRTLNPCQAAFRSPPNFRWTRIMEGRNENAKYPNKNFDALVSTKQVWWIGRA